MDLWIARTRQSRFSKASFHTDLLTREYFVVDASDSQVFNPLFCTIIHFIYLRIYPPFTRKRSMRYNKLA